MNRKLLEYRISHITIRKPIMGGFDGVYSAECRRDPHGATFSQHELAMLSRVLAIESETNRYRYQILLNYLGVLGVLLHLLIALAFDPE